LNKSEKGKSINRRPYRYSAEKHTELGAPTNDPYVESVGVASGIIKEKFPQMTGK
jgi:hypothetical protein